MKYTDKQRAANRKKFMKTFNSVTNNLTWMFLAICNFILFGMLSGAMFIGIMEKSDTFGMFVFFLIVQMLNCMTMTGLYFGHDVRK